MLSSAVSCLSHSGSSCSKLTMSLVNNSLKYQMAIFQIAILQMAILQIQCFLLLFFLLKICENPLQLFFVEKM